MRHLALSFFGTLGATLGGKPLTNFRSVKVQGLLVYLVLTAQQTHRRNAVAAMFWPDEPETTAKHNLRQSLYWLRQLLGDADSQKRSVRQAQDKPSQPDQSEPYLLVTHSTIQFNPASDHSMDVADFLAALAQEDLERAVSLYPGDLLPGFSCDSLPFDDWLRQEREQYHRLALDSLYQLTSDSLSQADFQTARRLAQKQVALEPWREEAHRQVMQALAALGERTAALVQYESCRAVLAEELGVDPSPETTRLAKRIREDQRERPPQLKLPDDVARQRLKIPFVGRKAEYETLVKAYQQLPQQGVQVVAVQGQAGIGKTRLTEQFVTWAATQGADVLYGRSYETSAGLSYQPLTHLLRQRIERENAPDDLLSDLWLSQLTRLLPELRDRYPDLPEPTQEEATAKQHLFEAVTRLGQALAARQPLVLFIDDWHWADTASLDLLHYAVGRWAETAPQTGGLPILIVLTLRQEAVAESPEVQSWLTKLNHAVDAVSLQLSELSQPETEALIQTLLAPEGEEDAASNETQTSLPKFSQWLFKETDGQPLFLTETLKALVEDGLVQSNSTTAVWQIDWSKFDEQEASGRILHGVQALIQGWLARIMPQARGLLTAASVLGQDATFDHLCRVAGLEEIQAIEALDDLLGKQLLREAGAGSPLDTALSRPNHDPIYSFYHQKVSEVVYAEAGTARRRLLHRRAFETLEAGGVAPADLAYHALNAGLVAETIQYSLIAGNEAMALFAVRVAITHYETAWHMAEQKGWPEAVSGADREALSTGLGRAYELIEAWPKAQQIYETMIADAQTIEAAAMECLGLNHLATVYLNGLGDRSQALALLERAKSVAEQHGDRRGLAETEWNFSMAAIQEQKPHLALQHGERAVALARELGHPHLLARCLTSLGQAYAFLRQWDKAVAYVTETHQLYLAEGDLVLATNSQRGLGFLQIFSGRPAESLVMLQEAYSFSQRIENLMGEADCAWILARTHLELGNYGQAISVGQQALALTRMVETPLLHVFARSTWGIIQRTIMAWESAQKTLLDLLEQTPEDGMIGWTDQAPELCALYASVGEWGQAHEYAKQVIRTHRDEPLLPFNLTGWYETEALLRGGDDDLARAEVERLAGIVGNNRRYHLPLLRSQAVLAQWDGDLDQAITHLEAALALAQEIGLPGEAWPILGELGKLYGEHEEQSKAKQAWNDSVTIIRRLAETIAEEGLRVGFLAAAHEQLQSP